MTARASRIWPSTFSSDSRIGETRCSTDSAPLLEIVPVARVWSCANSPASSRNELCRARALPRDSALKLRELGLCRSSSASFSVHVARSCSSCWRRADRARARRGGGRFGRRARASARARAVVQHARRADEATLRPRRGRDRAMRARTTIGPANARGAVGRHRTETPDPTNPRVHRIWLDEHYAGRERRTVKALADEKHRSERVLGLAARRRCYHRASVAKKARTPSAAAPRPGAEAARAHETPDERRSRYILIASPRSASSACSP